MTSFILWRLLKQMCEVQTRWGNWCFREVERESEVLPGLDFTTVVWNDVSPPEHRSENIVREDGLINTFFMILGSLLLLKVSLLNNGGQGQQFLVARRRWEIKLCQYDQVAWFKSMLHPEQSGTERCFSHQVLTRAVFSEFTSARKWSCGICALIISLPLLFWHGNFKWTYSLICSKNPLQSPVLVLTHP